MISFDSAASSSSGGAASLTFAHTCSGLNRILWVFIDWDGSPSCSGVSYAGQSMTRLQDGSQASNIQELYYIIDPALGNNNIIINMSGSTTSRLEGCSASYKGIKRSNFPDSSSASGGAASTTFSKGFNSTAGGCFAVCGVFSTGTGQSAGADTIQRATVAHVGIYDNGAPKSPPGSITLNFSTGGSSQWSGLGATFAPTVPGAILLASL